MHESARRVAAAPDTPCTRLPKPRRRFPVEVLTDPEVRALLDACGGPYHPVALRNRALIALMHRAGLRVSEALALSPKDVDVATGVVRVLHGKGDVSRTVGLDAGGRSPSSTRGRRYEAARSHQANRARRRFVGRLPRVLRVRPAPGDLALRRDAGAAVASVRSLRGACRGARWHRPEGERARPVPRRAVQV